MGESWTKFLGCLRTREALVAANCCGADQSAWKGTASQTGERRTGATRPGVWQSFCSADRVWANRIKGNPYGEACDQWIKTRVPSEKWIG